MSKSRPARPAVVVAVAVTLLLAAWGGWRALRGPGGGVVFTEGNGAFEPLGWKNGPAPPKPPPKWLELFWERQYQKSVAASDADFTTEKAAHRPGAPASRLIEPLMNAAYAAGVLADEDVSDPPDPAAEKRRAWAFGVLADRLPRAAALLTADPKAGRTRRSSWGNLASEFYYAAADAAGAMRRHDRPDLALQILDAAEPARAAMDAVPGMTADRLAAKLFGEQQVAGLTEAGEFDPARFAEARTVLDRMAADPDPDFLYRMVLTNHFEARFAGPRGVPVAVGADIDERLAFVNDWDAAHPDHPATAALRGRLTDGLKMAGRPHAAIAWDLETLRRFGPYLQSAAKETMHGYIFHHLLHRLHYNLRSVYRDREAAVVAGAYFALDPNPHFPLINGTSRPSVLRPGMMTVTRGSR